MLKPRKKVLYFAMIKYQNFRQIFDVSQNVFIVIYFNSYFFLRHPLYNERKGGKSNVFLLAKYETGGKIWIIQSFFKKYLIFYIFLKKSTN